MSEKPKKNKVFALKIKIIYFILLILGIFAMWRMVSLKINLGKYYNGLAIPQDSSVTIENRTFAFEYSSENGKRGNICSEDGTILLTDIYIYDLYWFPSNVIGKDSARFMEKADSLIDIFCQINPKYKREYYVKNIKERYIQFRKEWNSANEKEKSKDKQVAQIGKLEKQRLNKEKVLILVSNIGKPNKWVRQKHINAIDSLFVIWHGDKRFKGGCQKDIRYVRRQLSGDFPSSILGRMGTKISSVGIDSMVFNNGMEGYFDEELSGECMPKRILKVNGYTIRLRENKNLQPKSGKHIITTINTDIQRVTKSALNRYLALAEAKNGCAIVMEVKTGAIKAIVNLDRDEITGKYIERSDHTIIERFEPGSTFKLITLLAVLETGKIDTGDLVECEKGKYSLARAFEISDNEGLFNAARIAFGDINKFGLGVEKMGLQTNLDIEIKGAKQPLLRSVTTSLADFKNITHGYSVSVPPMYMLAYYNAIANNGVYVKPHLLKAMIDPNYENKNREDYESIVINKKICTQRTINRAKKCMEGVVAHGTARRIRDERYFMQLKDSTINAIPLIAGKTGTAFIYDETTKTYSSTLKNSSFIGYFPSEAPKYTCMVLIKGTTLDASRCAAPACKEIAEKLITNLNEFDISSQEGKTLLPNCSIGNKEDIAQIYQTMGIDIYYKGNSDYVRVNTEANSVKTTPIQIENIPLSSFLKGCNAKDAVYLLQKKGYQVIVNGRGKVVNYSIQGKTINLYLTN